MSAVLRCGWCGEDPLYVAYHDIHRHFLEFHNI